MKTNQIMVRKFLGHDIRQNHIGGYFNLTDFSKIANEFRKQNGLSKKQTAHYVELQSTKEFMTELAHEEDVLVKDLWLSKRGKNGGTWVHPIVFIDVAMWFNPKLKVKVLKWVYDELISARDEGGESYKTLMSELTQTFPEISKNPIWYKRISRTIYKICGLKKDDSDRWNKATVEQLKKRDKVHEQLLLLKDTQTNIGDLLVYVYNHNTKPQNLV